MAGDVGPKYPNQRLRSVSIETHFQGHFSVLAGLPDVQRMVGERLTELYVPTAKVGEASLLRPFQLRDPDNTRALAIALNQLSYIAFDYPGFETFLGEGVQYLIEALGSVGIDRLNRLTFAYDNHIGLTPGPNGELPISPLIDIVLPSWTDCIGATEVDMKWQRIWEHGQTHGRVWVEDQGGNSVLRIILAATVDPASTVDRIEDLSRLAHDEANAMFERLITDDFRAALLENDEEDEDDDDA